MSAPATPAAGDTSRPWPEIERAAVLDAMVVDARVGHRRGVVLCGDAGIGKTTIANQFARRRKASLITIRGGDVMSSVPYGALYGMLAESQVGADGARSLDQPGQVAAALLDAVEQRSADGAPTVILDNAALLDEASAFLLGQLGERIHLVVVSGTVGELPDPLLELWRDGVLGVVEVGPLTVGETGELLTRHLGSPVAQPAIEALVAASGGNALFLHYLVVEQVASGSLVQHDGVWVLERQATLGDQRLAELLRVRLDRWSAGQRLVLEIVALADSVPFSLLEQLVDAEDIASLLDDAVIQIVEGGAPSVRVRHRHIAELIRFGVSFLHRRQLRERVVAADTAGSLVATTEGVLAFAAWTLACGATLEPELALRAAVCANDMYDPELALRLAAAVGDGELAAAAAVEKSRAWRLLGLPGMSVNILRGVSGADEHTREPAALVELAAEWVASAHQVEGQLPEADRMIAAAQVAVDADATRSELRERLDIARWGLAAGSGRYVALVDELEGVTGAAAGGTSTAAHQAAARSVLAEAYSLVGRQHDAVELLDAGHVDLTDPRLSSAVRELGEAARFDVLLKSGAFDECLAMLERERDDRALEMLFLGSAADSAVATVLLFAGRAREALPVLHSALAQLRVRDVRATAGQVFAGLAYAHALLGDLPASVDALAEYGEGTHTYWHTRSSATYLALGAQAIVGNRDEAVAQMLATATEHHDAGLLMEELLLLAAAARHGSAEALDLIPSRTMDQPGALATRIGTWAAARVAGDPAQLVECAAALLEQDDVLFALDAAERAVELDPGSRKAVALVGSAQARMGVETTTVSNVLEMLTRRERDVAERAAGGSSNKDIAVDLFLSVRTVESYLQSSYGKLGVSGRSGLQELLA